MKRNLLRIIPFLLLGGVLGLAAAPSAFEVAGVKAVNSETTVNYAVSDFLGKGTSSTGSKVTVVKNPVTFIADYAYGHADELRVYSKTNNYVRISTSLGSLSSISFTFSGSNNGGLSTSYSFSNGETEWKQKVTAKACIKAISVTVSTADITVDSISLDTSNVKTTYVQGEAISYSGLKVTANYNSGTSGTLDSSKYSINPASNSILSNVGKETVSVTYSASSDVTTTSGEDITKTFDVTVTEKSAEMVFTSVTDVNDLAVGDMVLIANNSASKAAKSVLTQDSTVKYKHYLDVDTISINGNKATYSDSSYVSPYILKAGTKSGTFAFESEDGKYIAPYDDTNNGLVLSSTITNEASWSLSSSGNEVDMTSVINGTTRTLRYNSNAFRMYPSNSLMAKVNLYKYSSGLEKVVLDANAKDVYEGYPTTLTATSSGFTATSFVWESSNTDAVIIDSNGDKATVTIKGVSEGTSNVKVTVNDQYSATCVVTCKSAGTLVIDPGEYFITDLTNKYLMGADLSTIDDVDISQTDNIYTFEFAGLGDGTYWISNAEGKYLAFRQNIIPDGQHRSEMTLTDEKIDYWTITKNANNQYKVATQYGTSTKSIAQDGDHDWLAFDGDNYVNLTKRGNLVDFRVAQAPTKTKYYVGEEFKPAGLIVNAVYDVGGSEFLADVTSKIVWDKLVAGTKATGTYSSGEDAYDVIVHDLSILGPKSGSMTVTGLKDTYLVGEMPIKSIEEVKVTYSDGSAEEVKTLTEKEFVVSPDKINSSTTKITVSIVDFPDVKYEKDVTTEHAKYFATNMIEIGDKVTLGTTVGADKGNITGGYEIAINDDAIGSQEFGYLPTPAIEFEVVQGISSGTYAFKYNGSYLTSNGKTLDFGKISTINANYFDGLYDFNYPFYKPGSGEFLSLNFVEDSAGAESFGAYHVYNNVSGERVYADAIIVENTIIFDIEYYTSWTDDNPVIDEPELSCEFNGTWVIYLPTSDDISEKNSFTCNFVETQNEWVDDYWEICPVDEPTKHVFFNSASGKFGVATDGDYNAMLYRDMTKDFSHQIKSLSVSIPEDMPNTVSLNGTYNWVGITVKATYDNTTKKLPLGAYEVDIPALDTFGEKTCTVTYGTSGNKVSATFKIYVVGNYQPFIKQNTFEVWVDDTNTFTTTQEPPEGQPVTWSSSNPEVADFEDPSVGDLTSYKSGKVEITVTSADGYYSDSSELTVSQRPTGLTLNITEKTIKQGEKFTITGTVSPSDAKNKTVLWSSSDEEIATVNSKGEVTGLGVGDVIITGQTQGKGTGEEIGYKATCVVHVEEGEVTRVTGVSLDCTYKELKPGDTFQLNAIVNPSDATNKNVTWESNAPQIADVSNSGKVTVKNSAQTGKTVYITCTTEDGGYTARCEIKTKGSVDPVHVQSVVLNTTSKSIDVSETFELVATVNPSNADTKTVNWTCSDESVLQIISRGPSAVTLYGVKDGIATVTASCDGKTATCKVIVGDPITNVTGVSLNFDELELKIGSTFDDLSATVSPGDATDNSVIWSSSDSSVVEVDQNGKLTAKTLGEVIITVKTVDGEFTATCTVTVKSTINVGCGGSLIAASGITSALAIAGVSLIIAKKKNK